VLVAQPDRSDEQVANESFISLSGPASSKSVGCVDLSSCWFDPPLWLTVSWVLDVVLTILLTFTFFRSSERDWIVSGLDYCAFRYRMANVGQDGARFSTALISALEMLVYIMRADFQSTDLSIE
jgi:hypothetical protein